MHPGFCHRLAHGADTSVAEESVHEVLVHVNRHAPVSSLLNLTKRTINLTL